jgi:hypothetical protein
MKRHTFLIAMVATLLGVLPLRAAWASAPADLQGELSRLYKPSVILIENSRDDGAVLRQGAVLTVQADGLPANPFGTITPLVNPPQSHLPNFPRHLRNYARVDVAAGGTVTAERGAFSLAKGTRLVILDLKVKSDSVALFTHTAQRVRLPDGRVVYGCTGFVFHIDPAIIQRSDLAAVRGVIDRWLAPAA